MKKALYAVLFLAQAIGTMAYAYTIENISEYTFSGIPSGSEYDACQTDDESIYTLVSHSSPRHSVILKHVAGEATTVVADLTDRFFARCVAIKNKIYLSGNRPIDSDNHALVQEFDTLSGEFKDIYFDPTNISSTSHIHVVGDTKIIGGKNNTVDGSPQCEIFSVDPQDLGSFKILYKGFPSIVSSCRLTGVVQAKEMIAFIASSPSENKTFIVSSTDNGMTWMTSEPLTPDIGVYPQRLSFQEPYGLVASTVGDTNGVYSSFLFNFDLESQKWGPARMVEVDGTNVICRSPLFTTEGIYLPCSYMSSAGFYVAGMAFTKDLSKNLSIVDSYNGPEGKGAITNYGTVLSDGSPLSLIRAQKNGEFHIILRAFRP